MLRTIFFDFNGVLVDDEPLHFKLFQKVLAPLGIELTQKNYYENYLGYDDHDCFTAVLTDFGYASDEALIQKLTVQKNQYYLEEVRAKDLFIPGSIDFAQKMAKRFFLGIVSGALRGEIEAWLQFGKIESLFQTIVSANETKRGKPHPEGYLRALDDLNRDCVAPSEIILPQECLVIEDSLWGIEAAHSAGMKCLGLATSYPPEGLKTADWVAKNFAEIPLEEIEKSFK